ncbi:MAG TPA: HD domain-containing protein [Pirellulales bacterium]|nr:HD domain-containing protein [Pirellulales bacterium]
MTNLSNAQRLAEAISFAARAHQGHLRKDGETPYVAHPMRVLAILATEFGVTDPDVLAAAVLHDVIEDTRTDHDDLGERFGARVAEYVAALSKDKRLPEDVREQQYLERLIAAPLEVKLCKLGDVYDNLADSESLTDAGRAKHINKARELVARFSSELPAEWRHVLTLVNARIELASQLDGFDDRR